MRQEWPELLEQCKQRELHLRKDQKGLLPSVLFGDTMGGLPSSHFALCFEEFLMDSAELNLSWDDTVAKSYIKTIVDALTKAFIMIDEDGER